MLILAQKTFLQNHTLASFPPICFNSIQNITLSIFKATKKPGEAAGTQPLSKIHTPSEMRFWSMKTGLSIHGISKRGITPATRKKHGRHSFLSLLTATLSNRFHKFVCPKSLERRESKRQDLSFPPLYQHPDNTPAPTTHGKSNRLCKLPGHYGMLQKTNMQPMASATSSKSELLFALYLGPVCVSTAPLCQALSAAVGPGCCP